jgi:catechol 2,3-dioxygenase-like lactoylglutathione lyase family enzyme
MKMRKAASWMRCAALLLPGIALATPAAAADPPLTHFLIGLSVKDLKAETDWYVSKLGFTLEKDVSVGNGRVFFRWLRLGDERLELIYSPTATDAVPARAKPTGHAGLHGYTHFTFETHDLAASKAALLAKGVPLAVDITEVKDLGIRAIYVTDPEGNAVEIIERVK